MLIRYSVSFRKNKYLPNSPYRWVVDVSINGDTCARHYPVKPTRRQVRKQVKGVVRDWLDCQWHADDENFALEG